MTTKATFKTLNEFLFQDKTFVIPNYQRGYKWSVKKDKKTASAVEKLLDDLITANKEEPYFLQGITVVEKSNEIVLIDGQQRVTSLYLLLWCLDKKKAERIDLLYDVRESSKFFIESLKQDHFDFKSYDRENKNQDIYYFKQAIKQIEDRKEYLNTEFIEFLLNKVNILYIVIDENKATKTFTMMNGSKATMLQSELVKAEVLRRISLPEIENKDVSSSIDDNLNQLKELIAQDWETNALRSRYAREWDKWLYWWNRKEVKTLFGVERPMGWLFDFYLHKNNFSSLSFDEFKKLLVSKDGNEKQTTKHVFKEIRDLQKSFEDLYNYPIIHNHLKLALLSQYDRNDRWNIIEYFIKNKNDIGKLKNYSKWRLVGANHTQITQSDKLKEEDEKKEDRAAYVYHLLSQSFVYNNVNDLALKQLLRLNVEEDNKLFNGKGRRFDFTIYGNKSLEHIYPKSKVYHKKDEINDDGDEVSLYFNGNNDLLNEKPTESCWLNRDDMKGCTEHSIGNLVLLDKDENSKFSDKEFQDKKKIYFNTDEVFKSRNLLHTISVFSKSEWSIKDIEENQEAFLKRFRVDYNINDKQV